MFARPVIAVNNTQIFARLSGKGTQYLAYQMNYRSDEPNAMILPIPVRQPANDNSVRFIDLKGYESLFEDLADGFPYDGPAAGLGCSGPAEMKMAEAGLAVIEVGNYIASFVPTLSDFDRLDPKFRLPNDVLAGIPGYINFGFAVFQLAAGSLRPHPMAFEFQTRRDNQEIFFPTIHVHDGEVHESEEFDHALYLQHAQFDEQVDRYRDFDVEDKATGMVRSKYRLDDFAKFRKAAGVLKPNLLVHKKIMHGYLPNTDTVFSATGHPTKLSFSIGNWLASYTPWLVGLAAIAWFFKRRSSLMQDPETLTRHALSLPEEERTAMAASLVQSLETSDDREVE